MIKKLDKKIRAETTKDKTVQAVPIAIQELEIVRLRAICLERLNMLRHMTDAFQYQRALSQEQIYKCESGVELLWEEIDKLKKLKPRKRQIKRVDHQGKYHKKINKLLWSINDEA